MGNVTRNQTNKNKEIRRIMKESGESNKKSKGFEEI